MFSVALYFEGIVFVNAQIILYIKMFIHNVHVKILNIKKEFIFLNPCMHIFVFVCSFGVRLIKVNFQFLHTWLDMLDLSLFLPFIY